MTWAVTAHTGRLTNICVNVRDSESLQLDDHTVILPVTMAEAKMSRKPCNQRRYLHVSILSIVSICISLLQQKGVESLLILNVCTALQEFLLNLRRKMCSQAQLSCISNSVFYRQWEFARWEVNAFFVVIHIHKNLLQYPTLYEVCKWLKITSLHLVPFQSLPQHSQVIQFSLLNHYFCSNLMDNIACCLFGLYVML